MNADPEARTTLAWERSSLAFFVISVAMARGIGRLGLPAHVVAGMVVFAMGVVVAAVSAWWARRRQSPNDGPLQPVDRSSIAAVTVTIVLVATVSFVVALSV
jgi:uncharacterized membrane protein YidH (DUF202 family)